MKTHLIISDAISIAFHGGGWRRPRNVHPSYVFPTFILTLGCAFFIPWRRTQQFATPLGPKCESCLKLLCSPPRTEIHMYEWTYHFIVTTYRALLVSHNFDFFHPLFFFFIRTQRASTRTYLFYHYQIKFPQGTCLVCASWGRKIGIHFFPLFFFFSHPASKHKDLSDLSL